jgi:hypothetical protein
MPIAGPLRSMNLQQPDGTADLESWLRQGLITPWFRDLDKRLISESKLIRILKDLYPGFENVRDDNREGVSRVFPCRGAVL